MERLLKDAIEELDTSDMKAEASASAREGSVEEALQATASWSVWTMSACSGVDARALRARAAREAATPAVELRLSHVPGSACIRCSHDRARAMLGSRALLPVVALLLRASERWRNRVFAVSVE